MFLFLFFCDYYPHINVCMMLFLVLFAYWNFQRTHNTDKWTLISPMYLNVWMYICDVRVCVGVRLDSYTSISLEKGVSEISGSKNSFRNEPNKVSECGLTVNFELILTSHLALEHILYMRECNRIGHRLNDQFWTMAQTIESNFVAFIHWYCCTQIQNVYNYIRGRRREFTRKQTDICAHTHAAQLVAVVVYSIRNFLLGCVCW